ncbi:MAG: TIGR02266 family protein [Proteobacteria bacterium]|nr:TIGR02266 family protein [Pseudomonadota bacterium]
MESRRHQRIPYVVEVEFRTASSFLIAYSVNLSRGGIFLKTSHKLSVGAPVALQFSVPGAGTIRLEGRVAWQRREHRGEPGSPPQGLGIEFKNMDDVLGSVIDRLVSEFQGVRTVVVSPGTDETTLIIRMIRGVVSTADITIAHNVASAGQALANDVDVAIVMASAPFAFDFVHQAKNRARPVPVVAVASTRVAHQQAVEAGADEVVDNPPSFVAFQTALVRALGRPMAVR